MPKPSYRVLYNQDCTNLFCTTSEPIEPWHVERMVDEVADGGVDVLLVNPNAQRTCYPSRAWQTYWDGYASGDRDFFGPVPDDTIPRREHYIQQMKRLADRGCDYLAHALAHCRERGIAPGITVRMNDMHDNPWVGSHIQSRFYLEHPEFRLQNPQICGWGNIALNYEHAEVREYYLALIRELALDYDCDVMELDFMRFTSYFPREDFGRHCEIMTEFVRQVRAVLDEAARPIALIPRVPTNAASAYELGSDLAVWAREGLVDGLTASAFLNTSWEMPIEEFRSLAGDGVAIYACTDFCADRRDGLPLRYLPLDAEMLRGFAAGYLATGADGVAFLNFFCAREQKSPQAPLFGVLGELGSLSDLREKARTHLVTAGCTQRETDGPLQVPIPVPLGITRGFHVLSARPPNDAQVEIHVTFTEGEGVTAEKLWMQMNNVTLGVAREIEGLPDTEAPARRAVFTAPADAVVDGRNQLTLRNEGTVLTVLGLEIRIQPA